MKLLWYIIWYAIPGNNLIDAPISTEKLLTLFVLTSCSFLKSMEVKEESKQDAEGAELLTLRGFRPPVAKD